MAAKIRRLPLSLADTFEKAMNEYEAYLTGRLEFGVEPSIIYRSAFRHVERQLDIYGRGALQFARQFRDEFALLCWDEDDYMELLFSTVIESHVRRMEYYGTMDERIDAMELLRAWNCAKWTDSNGDVIETENGND